MVWKNWSTKDTNLSTEHTRGEIVLVSKRGDSLATEKIYLKLRRHNGLDIQHQGRKQ